MSKRVPPKGRSGGSKSRFAENGEGLIIIQPPSPKKPPRK